ncbi:serine protease [Shewanella schlegeliana]|uniref:S8 family serine peptidase n=1 Tax=Shewanella schlegeliana TaxID=190308 RepID=A0ABS1T297_9GAMM|nr:S8 family serine peptidase [Shewanella schlegeliana]MBL4914254.1 S8 family serine peptidase [Shewanella schlegeliana]GIU33676.1 serine protease [Shewanella schlegeliana]
MKLKKISLMTVAAIYAAGAGATALNSAPNRIELETLSVKPFEMSNEHYEAIKAASQERLNRPGMTAKPNNHRPQGQAEKIPFKFEKNITGEHTYIIQLAEQPVATYDGNISGFTATALSSSPQNFSSNNKINLNSSASHTYLNYLENRQLKVNSLITNTLGSPKEIEQSYRYAFNGMSMKLTQQQAARVAKIDGVRAVTRSVVLELHTDVGPQHIGADKVWSGETSQASPNTGHGVVVGILDTGINSDHPSFAPVGDDNVQITNPLGSGNFIGDCALEEFANLCNDKLIGIRSYSEITDSYGDPIFRGMGPLAPWERIRPANGEDYNGHGSHTASTVAGNVLFDVPYQMSEIGADNSVTGRDTEFVFERVSGVAPHANIVAYQVCFPGTGSTQYVGCPQDITLKAVDDAIADGVDVINYSVGGAEQLPWESPTELAFLAAREAGISVSASAGNAGYGWMDHVSPWLTSVAATTHSRDLTSADKTLDNFEGGDENPSPWGPMTAASITGGYSGPVFLAADYNSDNGHCDTPFAEGTFNFMPDGVTALSQAPIIVCARSNQARVTKSDNIKAGGAGGFILYNLEDDWSVPASVRISDYYSLPAAHVNTYDGSKIINWLASGTGHHVTISDGSIQQTEAEADQLANFSSRGPSVTNPHVMAPTLAAPGVNIFAAYANDRIFSLDNWGMNWSIVSGTSMAAPHVAGTMALLKNARPNWTPAQIQSALTTTANKVEYSQDGYGGTYAVTYDDAGAGVVDVAKAIDVGLVMDENIENYKSSNPLVGGDVTALNTPYIVNRDCNGTCSWYRTFTATQDGSWNVSAQESDFTGASTLKLEVSPKTFSLQAGEQQRVMITAHMPDIDYQSDSPVGPGNTDGITLYGKLTLAPSSATMPVQSLPIIASYERAKLPVIIQTEIGRDQGSYETPSMLLPQSAEISAVAYGLTTGTETEHHLKMNTQWPWEVEGTVPAAETQLAYKMFTVPEGTKRLIVEITDEDDYARYSSRIDLGRDVNNDGNIDYMEEALCVSDWRLKDYCAINNPEPGQYWYMVSNLKWSVGNLWDPYDEAHRIVSNLVIVSDEVSNNLTVSPVISDGVTPSSLSLNWALDQAIEGDILHGVIELGLDSSNPDDIGMLPVRFTKGEADVQFTASHEGARIGNVIDFELIQQANLFGHTRDIDMNVAIPEGLTLIAESVRGNEFTQPLISVDGNQINIAGTQQSSKDAPRTYEYTTSLEDEMCRLPFSDYPTFVDLPGIGVPQVPGFENIWDQMFEIPDFEGYDKYFPHVPLYGIEAKDTTNIIQIYGNGILKFDAHAFNANWAGSSLAPDGIKDLIVAPLWRRDSATLNESGMDLDTFTPYERGVYAASLNQEKYFIVQWKEMYNVEAGDGPWGMPTVDREQNFDFQVLASTNIDFTPGAYELYFSYKDLNGDKSDHTIGLKGYQGTRGFYYPVNGFHYDDYAVNEDDKTDSDMIICANYQGPESTRMVMRFSAVVNPSAAANVSEVSLTAAATNGNTVERALPIAVAGNITIFDIADQLTEENTESNPLTVEYLHNQNRQVTMSVSGENVTANIDGLKFSLVPDSDWHGTTEVTVTVHDMAYPSDQASTRFMLTVNSDGIEPTPPPAEETPDEQPKSDSGGSLGFLALTLLGLIVAGRRKRH